MHTTPRWSSWARKESAHADDTPAHDAPPPTQVGRHAPPPRLAPHHGGLPPLCRRLRAALWGLPRAPRPGAGLSLSTLARPKHTGVLDRRGADRLCAAL